MQLPRSTSPGLVRALVVPVVLVVFALFAVVPARAQSVSLEKRTNGQDADVAPGPILTVGDPVTWTYIVRSTNGRALTAVVVTDDQLGVVSCPSTTVPPGGSMTCTANGTAQAGQYENLGTVTVVLLNGDEESASDPSHYFGVSAPAITIEKSTEGFDADLPPGPSLAVGDPVGWTYEVTNVGTDPLTNIDVTDDHGVTVTCPQTTLGPSESMTCTASGTVQLGQYTNLGMVTALLPGENVTADSDPSHYFGQRLVLEKRTEGQDADSAPGPVLTPGAPVSWTYEVRNPGPAAVTNLSVTDDQGVVVTCPQTTVPAGQTVVCTASGTAMLGQYENLGTATAELPSGGVVSDSDPSHYLGSVLEIQKATNGQDADTAPGPTILAGDPVAWTYVVTNHGDETLTEVTVIDDQGETVSCPQMTLGPGESMTCTASGTATEGQYENLATATATGGSMELYSASDPSHYFGQPPAPDVSATKSAVLADSDGVADPGDVIGYSVTITNDGSGDANGVVFADTPDANTTLIAGTVTTTQGTVTMGNGGGDTSVGVDVGTLAAGGGTVTIAFDVTVNDPLPDGVTEIANQGAVGGDDFADLVTDDPSEPGGDDPTVVPAAAAPPPGAAEIPTLGPWGALALLALLAGLAVAKLGGAR